MRSAKSAAVQNLEQYHAAAEESLFALVRLQLIPIITPADQWNRLTVEFLYQTVLVPLLQPQGKVSAIDGIETTQELVLAARLELGLDQLRIYGMTGATTHELVLGAPLFYLKWWNDFATPDIYDPPTSPLGPSRQPFTIRPAPRALDVTPYLARVHQGISGFSALLFRASLEHEFAELVPKNWTTD